MKRERSPLTLEDARAFGEALDRSRASLAAAHGEECAERAQLAVMIMTTVHLLDARGTWRREQEKRMTRAIRAYEEARDAERDLRDTLVKLARRYTSVGVRCSNEREKNDAE